MLKAENSMAGCGKTLHDKLFEQHVVCELENGISLLYIGMTSVSASRQSTRKETREKDAKPG